MSDPAITPSTRTITIGGDMTVNRLGFGTMRLPGPGVWGPPRDHREAIRVLRRSVKPGANFIDTADSCGPDVAEDTIAEALHPHLDDVVIATKAGLLRTGPITGDGAWPRLGRPEYLRHEPTAAHALTPGRRGILMA